MCYTFMHDEKREWVGVGSRPRRLANDCVQLDESLIERERTSRLAVYNRIASLTLIKRLLLYYSTTILNNSCHHNQPERNAYAFNPSISSSFTAQCSAVASKIEPRRETLLFKRRSSFLAFQYIETKAGLCTGNVLAPQQLRAAGFSLISRSLHENDTHTQKSCFCRRRGIISRSFSFFLTPLLFLILCVCIWSPRRSTKRLSPLSPFPSISFL